MTGHEPLYERSVSDETRRSFLKKGAVATAGVAAASGTVSGQTDDGNIGDLDDNWKALVFIDNFHPNARFAFVSGVVEWSPNYGDVRDSFFSDYNTQMIRWLNTDEVVPLFVAEDANVGEFDADAGFVTDVDDDGNQPQLFEMNREWTPFGDNERLITVNVSPVGEDEEDRILEDDNWWQETNGGGTEVTTETPTGN
jgi:hypothetical protein